jgi:hypothetical protein
MRVASVQQGHDSDLDRRAHILRGFPQKLHKLLVVSCPRHSATRSVHSW